MSLICEECGKPIENRIQRHHISYAKDETILLCNPCHRKIHSDKTHRFYPVDTRKSATKSTIVSIRMNPKEFNAIFTTYSEIYPTHKVKSIGDCLKGIIYFLDTDFKRIVEENKKFKSNETYIRLIEKLIEKIE